MHDAGTHTIDELAAAYNVSRPTIYRRCSAPRRLRTSCETASLGDDLPVSSTQVDIRNVIEHEIVLTREGPRFSVRWRA